MGQQEKKVKPVTTKARIRRSAVRAIGMIEYCLKNKSDGYKGKELIERKLAAVELAQHHLDDLKKHLTQQLKSTP